MTFVEHKQELSKFWLSLISMWSPLAILHAKTTINLIPETGQHLYVRWFTGISKAMEIP